MLSVLAGIFLIGAIGFIFIRYKEKLSPEKEEFLAAQDLMDIKEVNGEIAITKKNRYVKIIQIGSINYFLLSDEERAAVDTSFGSLLFGLTFPVQFYVQTRLLDLSSTIESLKEDAEDIPEEMQDYGHAMIDYLSRWISMRKVMIRTPYVVFAATSKDADEAQNELQHRQQLIIDGLTRCGLSARVLRDQEMVDLWYGIYNKDRALIAPIKNVETPLYVKGGKYLEKIAQQAVEETESA